ncbi:flagellar hook-associated protein FlgL [Caballeronia sp. BR00000012568055]|uniref:flagellar hook-associated protein FlgL n=1 Tax=Caballeronia sp. BR00000012568055 TaxID=2918761 RepID=UPI0023F750F1|nr:flagellar hook-associated protein FlgL [Caballeronia sp. BR00000012568055]
MRISSSQYFNLNVSSMSDQQSTLATMYQQISSGKRISSASDDPLGAAQAVTLTMQSGALSQYGTNQTQALSSLQQEDSTLSDVSNVMQSVQTQIIHAGDGSLTDADRSSIATVLQGYRDQLMNLGNTQDTNGNYIFSGTKGGSAALTNNASGVGASYDGDLGQRTVQINSSRTVSVGDTAASIFQSVSATESSSVPSATTGNAGTGVISAVSMNDSTNTSNSSTFKINFAVSGGATTYTVTTTPPGTTSAAQAFTAGSKITLGGQSVQISGAPANGDSFNVQPAASGNTDVFTTLDNLISALKQPLTGSSTAQATLSNALATAGTQIGNSLNNVLAMQTSVGGREQQVQAAQTALTTSQTQNKSDLANLTSIDLVSSISSYELTQNSLQAAQMAFSQIQKMSLFNYLS